MSPFVKLTGLICVIKVLLPSIFIVLAFSTIVVVIVSTVVTSVAFVTSLISFAAVAAVVFSLDIVKSSGEGLERLLKLSLKGFDFVGS